ncbi:MAG TPA: hypothetical protein PKK13_08290 [Spirochaetota bacterium]|jgi:hypothetical protein|nr:hypothetical protein [Spirochaetota bacterium]
MLLIYIINALNVIVVFNMSYLKLYKKKPVINKNKNSNFIFDNNSIKRKELIEKYAIKARIKINPIDKIVIE